MAVYEYRKYKISLNHDTKKTQGLRTGDIVRRQFFDGKNLFYSLMCVLEYGIDQTVDISTNQIKEQPYFIGALLEGDAPTQGEILDFVRITNLYDQSRSGALYLTASDENSPYMDVIDGIGRNKSLCWPENIADTEYIDSFSQYVVHGGESVTAEYIKRRDDNNRICHITKTSGSVDGFIGIKQDFYQYVANPNRVLISYKIKSSVAINATVSLEYIDGVRQDGLVSYQTAANKWEYKFHAITVDWSGRHLRTVKLDFGSFAVGEEVWVADFNIILLSSVASFGDSSQIRVGKLDGVVDPVFGKLDSYGGYFQKLFASRSAHISGTLTAGDENGFAATFYAGKIHRNAFYNSTQVNFVTDIKITDEVVNPTGIGEVYSFSSAIEMAAQSNQWLVERVGSKYCFSFWAYAKQPCQLSILQNGFTVGTIQIDDTETHAWHRQKMVFELFEPETNGEELFLAIVPKFRNSTFDQVTTDTNLQGKDELVKDAKIVYFSAPQLEKGEEATQYQPTDEILNYTEDYGAWFSRGGIGGTIQNPLLQLNYDGEGSIGTRSKSLLLKTDGSGHLANRNIKWDAAGKVSFGKDVTLNWENLGKDTQDEIANRYMRIVGEDTFSIIGQETTDGRTYSPTSITLSLEEVGFASSSSQRQWYYKYQGQFVPIEGANGQTLTITPDSPYWHSESVVTFQCIIMLNESRTYVDTFTIKKQYVQGYSVQVVSEKGTSFQNGDCETRLVAQVYYQGKLVDTDYALENFVFTWKRYDAATLTEEDEIGGTIDAATPHILSLDYDLDGSEIFVCELATADHFDYSFPIIF